MFRTFLLTSVALIGLSACNNLSPGERVAVGTLAGAAAGLAAADALGADRNWTRIAALGGAAAGVLVARNSVTGQCAFSDGRGGYYTRRC